MVNFCKTYQVRKNIGDMRDDFDAAWRVTCGYDQIKIVTCEDQGWARISGILSQADAKEMEAKLDKVFS